MCNRTGCPHAKYRPKWCVWKRAAVQQAVDELISDSPPEGGGTLLICPLQDEIVLGLNGFHQLEVCDSEHEVGYEIVIGPATAVGFLEMLDTGASFAAPEILRDCVKVHTVDLGHPDQAAEDLVLVADVPSSVVVLSIGYMTLVSPSDGGRLLKAESVLNQELVVLALRAELDALVTTYSLAFPSCCQLLEHGHILVKEGIARVCASHAPGDPAQGIVKLIEGECAFEIRHRADLGIACQEGRLGCGIRVPDVVADLGEVPVCRATTGRFEVDEPGDSPIHHKDVAGAVVVVEPAWSVGGGEVSSQVPVKRK